MERHRPARSDLRRAPRAGTRALTAASGATYAPSPYLLWARQHYGNVPYDLAASGIPPASRELLGLPASLEDPRAWATLRSAIAAYNDVPVEYVTPTLGTSHAIWLAYATHLRPGDDVLVEEPGYQSLVLAAKALGARVRRFPRAPEEGYRLDVRRIARAIGPKTKLVVITNLHNPTGVRADDETLRALAAACAKKGVHLLVDEVYAPFDGLVDVGGVFRGSARKLAPNVVAIASLTKCYGLGLERIGWMLAPREATARAADAVTLTLGLTPLSHANLAAHAFTRVAVLADRARGMVRGKRELVEAWIASRSDLTWSAPEEGLFALVRVRGAGDLLPRIEAAITSHGIVVAAGGFFGVPDGFRVSWSMPEPKLLEALAILDEAIPPATSRPRRRPR